MQNKFDSILPLCSDLSEKNSAHTSCQGTNRKSGENRGDIGDKYIKVHNLGREIDNLHKNIVNIQDRRVLKTTARNDIDSAANSNITDAEVEEQNKRKINYNNLELGSKAHRYRMLVSGKYRDTCDKDKIVAEWKALSNRLEAAVHDSRV